MRLLIRNVPKTLLHIFFFKLSEQDVHHYVRHTF